MTKEFAIIYETTDYEKFTFLIENRDVNQIHLKRLIESFKKRQLVSAAIVNKKFEIIDGQHRFLTAKELGLPFYYYILPEYGIVEVQTLNTDSLDWKKIDFLKSYCDKGSVPHLQMRDFMNAFPDFGIAVSEQLLTNSIGGMNNKSCLQGGKGRQMNFQNGKLVIPDLKSSYANAEKIMAFKPYYSGFNRNVFVMAMMGLFKHENYNHTEMMNKIANNPTALKHCSDVTQYKMLLEDIYNYRRREKVNLRF